MIQTNCLLLLAALLAALAGPQKSLARSIEPTGETDGVSAVIPSPNQEFGDELIGTDLQRTSALPKATKRMAELEAHQAESSNLEASGVPVYVSPFARSERSATGVPAQPIFESRQESSHAPPNYAPRPAASASDLKASASYGHHHHGHHGHGYDHSGWLDMGAWTGGKGSFGWYADYPVGGKHHYGYGRR